MENNESTDQVKALAEALLQRAQAHAPEGVKARVYGAVTDGEKSTSYRGAIVHVEDGIAIQKLNEKGSFAVHEAEGLAVGEVLNIGYYKGVRSVAPHDPSVKAERPARAARAPKDPTLESNAPKESRKRPEGEPGADKKAKTARKTAEPKKSVAEIDGEIRQRIASRFLKAAELGKTLWHMPWKSAAKKNRPHNALTGANYQGTNRVIGMTEMAMRGSNDTRFMTKKQTEAMAATKRSELLKAGVPADDIAAMLPKVRDGAEFIEMVKVGRSEYNKAVLDEDGNPKKDADGKAITKRVQGRTYLQTFRVYHASDIENMPALEMAEPKAQWELNAECQHLLEASGVPIRYEPDNRAYYEPLANRITLPELVQFKTKEDFYSVALHEVAHSTGHGSKLNRPGIVNFQGFGSDSYSEEELVADTASCFVTSELGITSEAVMVNHESYFAGWASKIKNDPKVLFKAFAEAEQAADWVMQRHAIQLEAQAKLAAERGMDLGLQQGLAADNGMDYSTDLAASRAPAPASSELGMSM